MNAVTSWHNGLACDDCHRRRERSAVAGRPCARGTTLIELLVVIAIIGVLVGLSLPALQAARRSADRAERLNWIHQRRIGDPPFPKHLRALFVGNSRIYWNDIPGILTAMAQHRGVRMETTIIVEGGKTLEWHWNQGHAQAAITSASHDFAVFQEQGPRQQFEIPEYMEYASRFIGISKDVAIPLLYSSWRMQDTPPESQTRITETAFTIASAENNRGTEVCVIGAAWQRWDEENPTVSLYDDNTHPNIYGAYITACVVYATMLRQSPEGLPAALTTPGGMRVVIAPDLAADLQRVAWEAVEIYRERNLPPHLRPAQ